jgi:aminoglycoside phosphotransferase (APT) family kinase protein
VKTRIPPREDLAFDPAAVRSLLGAPAHTECRAEVLQRKPKRLVIRYEFDGLPPVVGKWYSSDRGALVWDALSQLRAAGFDGGDASVPAPVSYNAEHRVLFVEAIDGETLREAVAADPGAARVAGVWLARFHASPFVSPRDCGPGKMMDSVRRWSEQVSELAPLAPALVSALATEVNPGKPVHYDYYHAQVLCPPTGGAVVVDLDESGLGDPAFDVAHFIAHLRRLGVRQAGDASRYADAEAAFLSGYGDGRDLSEVRPVHEAFAWFKLAAQAVARGQREVADHGADVLSVLTANLR